MSVPLSIALGTAMWLRDKIAFSYGFVAYCRKYIDYTSNKQTRSAVVQGYVSVVIG
jgi:hypothetical protein